MDKPAEVKVSICESTDQSEKNDTIISEIQAHAPTLYSARRAHTVRRRRQLKRKPLPLDRASAFWHRVPIAIKILIVVILTGIPFMIFMLVARFALQGQTIGPPQLHATYFRLSKWLMVCWGLLLIIFALADSLARLASYLCRQSSGATKYAPLANTLVFRVTMLVWSGGAYQANCSIWQTDAPDPHVADDWPRKLKQVFLFLIISFAILLVQGIVMELIAIRYIQGFLGPRSDRASNEIEIIRDLNFLLKKHIQHDDPSFMVKMLKKAFWPVEDSMFEEIIKGRANEEQHKQYAASLWQTVTSGLRKDILTNQDISNRMVQMGRDAEAGQELFAQLDESCDGEVTREELEALVVTTGAQLNKRAEAMHGIKRLLFKLEILLTCCVFGVIVFVYSNFFNQSWVQDSKALWTGITGLGFALNGTIADFVSSCVFVFAKHAYDVGDLVEAKTKKLVVKDIRLTHTNFQEIREGESAEATGMVVQISHSSLAAEVITNWTRSNDLKIAEKEKKEASE